MKGMASAKEFPECPPEGRYKSKIVVANPKLSKSGNSMLEIVYELREPEEFVGVQSFDYIITDGGAKGGGFGKRKLRALGIDVDTSDAEVPDEQLAAQLLGLEVWVQYEQEQIMDKDGAGNYTKPRFETINGVQTPVNRLKVKEVFRHDVGQPAGTGAGAHALPGQVVQQPQQFQQFQGQPQQGFQVPAGQVVPVQGQPLYGQVPPGGQWQPQTQGQQAWQPTQQVQGQGAISNGPPGVAPGVQQQGAPNGQTAQGVAVPPWQLAQQAGAAQAEAQATQGGGGKTGKGKSK